MIPLKDDNPTEITPYLTITFIIACVLVFLYQVSLPGKPGELFVYQYGAIPAVVFGHTQLPAELIALPAYGTLLSSMFLHGGWMHLIGNMLYLWIFGNNIEDVMGHGKFIVFYVLCGILAALSHATIDPESTVPMVGASGAISGVLGAYLLLYPTSTCVGFGAAGIFYSTDACSGSDSPGSVVCPATHKWWYESRPRRWRCCLFCACWWVRGWDGLNRTI